MRICLVIRGENMRTLHGHIDALDSLDNWRQTIFRHIECDIALITYPSPNLDKLIEVLKPVYVQTSGYNCQTTNAIAAAKWMVQNKENYDRFVVIRYDIVYRISINKWPCWDKQGITLISKDPHYHSIARFRHFYIDMVFVVDSPWVEYFYRAVDSNEPFALHHVGRDLERMGVEFNLMYDNFYNQQKNPLYVVRPKEPDPEIDDGYEGEPITDLTPFLGWKC